MASHYNPKSPKRRCASGSNALLLPHISSTVIFQPIVTTSKKMLLGGRHLLGAPRHLHPFQLPLSDSSGLPGSLSLACGACNATVFKPEENHALTWKELLPTPEASLRSSSDNTSWRIASSLDSYLHETRLTFRNGVKSRHRIPRIPCTSWNATSRHCFCMPLSIGLLA